MKSDSVSVIVTATSTQPRSGSMLLLAQPLFEGVQRDAILPLLGLVLIRKIARGTLLHSPGDRARPMYLLLSGRLRSYQLTPDGRRLVLEIIQPGGFDGVLPLFGKRGHFTEAAADSVVACLDWKLLERLFAAEPSILQNLVEMVAARLEDREEHLESMLIRDPTRRIARQLAALASAVGENAGDGTVVLPRSITHQLLADMLGIRRETVTVHLQDLLQLGAVDGGHRPLVVHPVRLEAVASSSDG